MSLLLCLCDVFQVLINSFVDSSLVQQGLFKFFDTFCREYVCG